MLFIGQYSWSRAIGAASVKSVESDLGCISRFYFDNVTLTSQKPCQQNNKFDCSGTNGDKILQEVRFFFSIKYGYSDISSTIKKKNPQHHIYCWYNVSDNQMKSFIRTLLAWYKINFGLQNSGFLYIILRLTCIWGLILELGRDFLIMCYRRALNWSMICYNDIFCSCHLHFAHTSFVVFCEIFVNCLSNQLSLFL